METKDRFPLKNISFLSDVADIKKSRYGCDHRVVSEKIMKVALAAAAELEKDGISAEVIDLRTVRPIDYATVS